MAHSEAQADISVLVLFLHYDTNIGQRSTSQLTSDIVWALAEAKKLTNAIKNHC